MRYCRYCGKEIADEAIICIHCGCKAEKSYSPAPVTENTHCVHNDMATASMWCGIASFFVGQFILGIAAIILALLSRENDKSPMDQKAKIGAVCGTVSTVLCIIVFAFVFEFILEYS